MLVREEESSQTHAPNKNYSPNRSCSSPDTFDTPLVVVLIIGAPLAPLWSTPCISSIPALGRVLLAVVYTHRGVQAPNACSNLQFLPFHVPTFLLTAYYLLLSRIRVQLSVDYIYKLELDKFSVMTWTSRLRLWHYTSVQ